MQNFEELLKARLEQPIKDKQGNLIVNQETQSYMTALEAMVMSVVNNAMKGDIASIAFIRNITHTPSQADNDRMELIRKQAAERQRSLTTQLKSEGLYDGQDTEIEQVANIASLVEILTDQMCQADFHPTITEYRRDGSTQTTVNPLVTRRDQQQQRFQQQLDKLRQDAMRRAINKRNMKL